MYVCNYDKIIVYKKRTSNETVEEDTFYEQQHIREMCLSRRKIDNIRQFIRRLFDLIIMNGLDDAFIKSIVHIEDEIMIAWVDKKTKLIFTIKINMKDEQVIFIAMDLVMA